MLKIIKPNMATRSLNRVKQVLFCQSDNLTNMMLIYLNAERKHSEGRKHWLTQKLDQRKNTTDVFKLSLYDKKNPNNFNIFRATVSQNKKLLMQTVRFKTKMYTFRNLIAIYDSRCNYANKKVGLDNYLRTFTFFLEVFLIYILKLSMKLMKQFKCKTLALQWGGGRKEIPVKRGRNRLLKI